MEKSKVILDADFFRHITEVEPNSKVLEIALDELKMTPVMHKYVADIELKQNPHLDHLIRSGVIEIIGESDFITEENIKEYERYFRAAYKIVNRIELGKGVDVQKYGYSFEAPKESLGEIRSIYLAMKKGYKIFLSDDNGSKLVAKYVNNSKHMIKVWKLYNLFEECWKIGTSLTWKGIRNIVAKGIKNEADRDKIRNLFCEIDAL